MLVFIVIGLITAVITIGLGYWSYILGKRNKSNLVGSVIPVGYFIVRLVFVLVLGEGVRELITSLVGNLVITVIYVLLFGDDNDSIGKSKQNSSVEDPER
ncbi:integral membrane protein [Lactiplantibacillus plantarum]|nr:integral membrane protein [Lactiplantibacillus plantarum]